MAKQTGFLVTANATLPLGQIANDFTGVATFIPHLAFSVTTPAGAPKLQKLPVAGGNFHDVGIFGTRSVVTGNVVEPGIQFVFSSNNRPLTEFSFVQTMSQDSSRLTTTGDYQEKAGFGLLDTLDPYPKLPGFQDRTVDSPSLDFTDESDIPISYYEHSQSFQMYLMWKSPRANSKLVPVAVVSWDWAIAAFSEDEGQTFEMVEGSNTYTQNPQALFTYEHPVWDGNVTNLEWGYPGSP